MRFVFSAVLSMAEKILKKHKNKTLTKNKNKQKKIQIKKYIQLTGCFVRMFLVCTFLVFILTVQFKLGWRWKKDDKRWRNSWIIFLCICCTCYCWYCIWYSDSVLNHWNSVVCHIVVSWKKWSISLWFSQWWQRRLSYLNGFYHFCSYWYYTSVTEITWQKKKEIWKHVDAKANRNKH